MWFSVNWGSNLVDRPQLWLMIPPEIQIPRLLILLFQELSDLLCYSVLSLFALAVASRYLSAAATIPET